MAAAPTNGMLRPALEVAWAVAKMGGQARPPVAPPGRLRPLMRFAKLPDRALSTVRQVVDEDDEFRARVAAFAQDADIGRASSLWLLRAEGWEEELAAMAEAAGAAALGVQEERDERSARKRLAVAEAAAARGEAELVRLRGVNTGLLAELTSERQARRRLEAERGALASATRAAGDQREQISGLETTISLLAGQIDEVTEQAVALTAERDAALSQVEHLRKLLEAAGTETARLTETRERTRATVGHALSQAASAASQLSQALADMAPTVGAEEVGSDSVAGIPAAVRSPPPTISPVRRPALVRRRPVGLPPAVFDDSFEAADYLVRVAGILLVVDGYNVTISSWPHLELPRQRHRLVDALAELAMRVGPAVHVVFDGTEAGGRFASPPAARRRMRVTFSPEGVDADEVIVNLVDQLDPAQPVVVATDDREVRDEVSQRGANVISVAQLLAVLGRAPGSAAG